MREVIRRIPEIDFYSFSSPETDEDHKRAGAFWDLDHIHRCPKSVLLLRSFDAVHHASATPANISASVVSKMRGFGQTQHIYTASIEPHEGDPYSREFAWSISHCDRLIAGSHSVAGSIERSFGRQADLVLPNGVDIEYFNPAIADDRILSVVAGRPYVLFVSTLIPRKRADIFVRIAEQMPATHFVMVGRPAPSLGGDEILARVSHVANLQYLGVQPKEVIRDLMSHAAVFIFPSELEGFANVLLEATAMGLPIIARPVSSMPDIVKEGVNGWLIPELSLDSWISKVQEVLAWPDEYREEFSKQAMDWCRQHHTWDAVAERLKAFYFATLEGPA